MTRISTPEETLRGLLKEVVEEALDERGDFFRDVMQEVLEDLALGEAISQGRTTKVVDRTEVFEALGRLS